MKPMNRKISYVLILLIGFCCLIFPSVLKLQWGSGLCTIVWLYVFLDLVCRFRSKGELLITTIALCLGFVVKYSGAVGYSAVSYGFSAVLGLVTMLIYYGSTWIMKKNNRFLSTLVFPFFWTAVYWLFTLVNVPSAIRIDILFIDMDVLIQSVEYIGSFGFTFFILWIVSLIRYTASKRKQKYVLLAVVIFLMMLLPGMVELSINVTSEQYLRVAYTTGPYVGDFLNYTNIEYQKCLSSMKKSMKSAAEQGAQILVFNEEAFEMEDAVEESFISECANLAKEYNLAVLVGLDITDTDNSENGKSINKLTLIDNNGEVVSSYIKTKLLPLLESDYVRGDGNIQSDVLYFDDVDVKVSYLICYDSNFPDYVAQIPEDTDILFLPSWDWEAVTELHANIASTIAAANDIYVFKPTYDGITVAVNPDGNIFYQNSTDQTGYESVQLVEIPVRHEDVYTAVHLTNGFDYAIIATEIMSIMVAALLLVGNGYTENEKAKRSRLFNLMIVTLIVGMGSDVISWYYDGCERMTDLLIISTYISNITTLIMMPEFIAYILEYIREKEEASSKPLVVFIIFTVLSVGWTTFAFFKGDLFIIENGIYHGGAMYVPYLIVNMCTMLLCILVVFHYRKSISYNDRFIIYTYLAIPIIAAVINVFEENFSFAYPAATLSMFVIYVMLQSDKVDRLEHEGRVVSYYASHDELTGIHNRRAFNDRFNALHEVEGTSGIIFADLNGLKHINDNQGHMAGDRYLVRFTALLATLFRTNEIYRISGDEFVCMMENVSEDTFKKRLTGLLTTLEKQEIPMASVGSAFGSNKELEKLLKDAEENMYIQKEEFHQKFPDMSR